MLEGLDDDNGMNVTFELGKGLCEDFSSYAKSDTVSIKA
jgi:hypothetical protein